MNRPAVWTRIRQICIPAGLNFTARAAMIRAVLDMMVTVTHDGVSAPSA